MNEPIDILDVAGTLRADAWSRVCAAMVMQNSPAAERFMNQSRAALLIANRDYEAVECLMMALRA